MSEIIKQIKDRYKIDLEYQGIKYELWRIDDTEYTKFRKDNSVAIETDCNFFGQLYLSKQYREDNNLNLAEWLCGQNGTFCTVATQTPYIYLN